MAYGLKVQSSTGLVQIDSTYEMFGTYVKKAAYGNTINNIDYANDVIVINMSFLASGANWFVAPSWNTDRTSLTFRNADARPGIGVQLPLVNVNYMHMSRIQNDVTTYTEDYGLQTKTPSGGLAFDSRALTYANRPVYLALYPTQAFKAWSNKLPDRVGSASAIVPNMTDYVSVMGGYINSPGTTPTELSFSVGVRFVHNVYDSYDGLTKTGAFHDTSEMLGINTQLPNLSSYTTVRDYQ
jgi:hypothetical protein